MKKINHPASFRDPAAQVFYKPGDDEYIYRSIHPSYFPHYKHFIDSGLSEELVEKKWMISYQEEEQEDAVIILKAEKVPFVSYPYEWSFDQWKAAALLILKIQFHALKRGMSLKDASPFNIVFNGAKPLLVDVTSFEIFKEGQPWIAFNQFSENFYLPVLLAKYHDNIVNELYLKNMHGIPLNKGLALLPVSAYLNINTLMNLKMPAQLSRHKRYSVSENYSGRFTQNRSAELADHLFNAVNKINQQEKKTQWNAYYDDGSADKKYISEKETVILEWITKGFTGKTLADLGCNTGYFSKLLAPHMKYIIALDSDARSVNQLYNNCNTTDTSNIFCLVADISNPTPATGWNNQERLALKERINTEAGLALALVHHLAFTYFIRFEMMSSFFSSLCKELIIEFIPEDDEKSKILLAGRNETFTWYNLQNFLLAFARHFRITKQHVFENKRILLHFTRIENEQ